MPPVYIIILNYKNWEDVSECLQSVFRLTYKNFKVFVVDNNSGNGSLEKLMEWAKNYRNSGTIGIKFHFFQNNSLKKEDLLNNAPLVFIQNDENKGFAAGNNLVLKHLKDEEGFVWLLNPDMVVEEDSLSELVKFAESNERRSIVGSIVKFYSDKKKVHLYGGARINFNSATVNLVTEKKEASKIDFICGGSVFVYAKHFKELGLLPEEYFLYWEETDWCYRAKQKGFEMLVCPTAVCYDKISTTIGKSFLADYYYTRNGLVFVSKFREKKIPIVLLSAVLRMMKRIFSGQWNRSRGVYEGILTFLRRQKNEN